MQRPVECLARLVVYAAVTKSCNTRLKLMLGNEQCAGARLPYIHFICPAGGPLCGVGHFRKMPGCRAPGLLPVAHQACYDMAGCSLRVGTRLPSSGQMQRFCIYLLSSIILPDENPRETTFNASS